MYSPTIKNQRNVLNICKETKRYLDAIDGEYFSWDIIVKAAQELKGESFKVWLYLCDSFHQTIAFAQLGQALCEQWGIKKDVFYETRKKLIDMYYLIPHETIKGGYYFFANKDWGEGYLNERSS